MTNQQPPERKDTGDGSILDLHSMFFTIQGEGPFTGHRAIFVRLAGCNLQCPGCDTEYTEGRRVIGLNVLVSRVVALHQAQDAHNYPFPLIVITGGEPLRQTIGPFVAELLKLGYPVQIESNGMFEPDKVLLDLYNWYKPFLTLVVSPKTAKVNPKAAGIASCFKYVMQAGYVDPEDGLPMFALEHFKGGKPARPPKRTKIYLNPYDEKDTVKNAANLAACAESCKKYGHILGVQLHKLAGLE